MEQGRPLVLVVDDHLDTCEVLVRLLRLASYRAVCADSGQRALEILDSTVPSMIFLDMMMPDVGGLDVLKAVRAKMETKAIPVVMYSADARAEASEAAMKFGASEFVVKGRLAFAELLAVVRRYVPRGAN